MKLFCFNKKKDTQRRPEMTLNRMELNQSFKKKLQNHGFSSWFIESNEK